MTKIAIKSLHDIATDLEMDWHQVASQETSKSALGEKSHVTAFSKFVEFLKSVDQEASGSGIAEQERYAKIKTGLPLINHLSSDLSHPNDANQFNLLCVHSVDLAYWLTCNGQSISIFECVVNGIAHIANKSNHVDDLTQLVNMAMKIVTAIRSEITGKEILENEKAAWTILNINMGIVATRTHVPRLIESAYDLLIENIPNDAKRFFTEGKKQMEIIEYPESVRNIVNRYYQDYCNFSVH